MSEIAVAELESQSQVADSSEDAQGEEDTQEEAPDGKSYLEQLASRRASREPKAPDSNRVEPTTPLLDPRAGQYIQDYRNLHTQRQAMVGAIEGELVNDYGIPQNIAKRIVNDVKGVLNAHHADGLRLSGYEAAATAVNYEQTHIQDAIAAVLAPTQLKKLSEHMQAEISQNGVATYQSTFKHMVGLAREGYIEESVSNKLISKAYDDGLKGREKRASTSDRSNAARGNLNSAAPAKSSGKITSLAEATAQHARGLISNQELLGYKQQFR